MKEITDIKTRAAKLGLPLKLLLSEASVNHSTWWRWSVGKSSPTLEKIKAVFMVLQRHEREKKRKP